jgi:RecA/RadA recombinase
VSSSLHLKKGIEMLNRKRSTKELSEEIKEAIENPAEPEIKEMLSVKQVISTGSTWLDLAICGERIHGGGVPGGCFMEISGPEASGKSALLAEMCGNVQAKGGDSSFKDPEYRIDEEYCHIYGMKLDKKNYTTPDTVEEVFEEIEKWTPQPRVLGAINFEGVDSLASLSTDMEMEDEDKMGQRRAKMFSQGFRKTCRLIKKRNILLACSNQMRDGKYGDTTPGGRAIKYYASLRIGLKILEEITKTIDISETPQKEEQKEMTRRERMKAQKEAKEKGEKPDKNKFVKSIGILTECAVKKSSVGEPYRKAKIYIIFGYGIDDIRGNLAYIKEMKNINGYLCPDGKTYLSLEQAVLHVEEQNLVADLKEQTITLWEAINNKFKTDRKPKER